tara:strand:- start:66 stop:266 length:201 start_codon:yes stop_codon:yes gene_type:complete
VKVGDLVELSAYGSKLKLNAEHRGRVGLIVRTDAGSTAHGATAISVVWAGDTNPALNIRKDVKYAK